LLAIRWRRITWIHLPMFAWGAIISFLQFRCPLTWVEKWARANAGRTSYEGGFIEHYLTPIIYPEGLDPLHFMGLGLGLIVLNAIVYGWIFGNHIRSDTCMCTSE